MMSEMDFVLTCCVRQFKGQFHLQIQIGIYYYVMSDTFQVLFYDAC